MSKVPCLHEQIKERRRNVRVEKERAARPKPWLKVTKAAEIYFTLEKGWSDARNIRSLLCSLNWRKRDVARSGGMIE